MCSEKSIEEMNLIEIVWFCDEYLNEFSVHENLKSTKTTL